MPCLVSCLSLSLSPFRPLRHRIWEVDFMEYIFSTPCYGMYTQQHTRQNAVHGWELGGMEDERDLKMRCDVILKFSFTTSAAWRRARGKIGLRRSDGGGFGTTRLVWNINHPPTGFWREGRMCFDVSWLPFLGCKFIYILRWARTQILNAFLPKTCSTYSQGCCDSCEDLKFLRRHRLRRGKDFRIEKFHALNFPHVEEIFQFFPSLLSTTMLQIQVNP